jgi:NarL family two-component system response regulator LiaR
MNSAPISVLIADDHGVVREGIRAFLATQPDLAVVADVDSGEAAAALCVEHVPDVALVDLLMPGIDGVETTRRIKAASPRTQVVVLTSSLDEEHAVPALRAGAISYLLKDVSPEELVDAVRRAARGESVLHPSVAARLVAAMRAPETSETRPLEAQLSPREREVLAELAQGASNAEIAERLAIGEKTVKSHVSNILGKLQLDDRTQAAVYAWRSGFVRR